MTCNSVALATVWQVAFAARAFATVVPMATRINPEVGDARAKELARFLRLAFDDNKAALGRRLGYKDGSFVGQMLRGEKAITETTWERLCDLREVKPLLTNPPIGGTHVFHAREESAQYMVGNSPIAHAMSQRRQIIAPRKLVWEDMVITDVHGQFIMTISGDALAPAYLPGQSGIWEAGDHGNPGQPVLLADSADRFYLRLYEPRPGGSWAGVSQRVGHPELNPEQHQVRVVARLRYLDLG